MPSGEGVHRQLRTLISTSCPLGFAWVESKNPQVFSHGPPCFLFKCLKANDVLNVCKLGMKEVVSHLAKIGRKWYAECLVAIWCCVPSGIGVPFENLPSSWYGKLISWPVLDCEAVTPEEEKALKSGFMAKLQAGSVEPFVRKRGRTAMESVQIAWFYDPTIGLFGVGQGQKTELAHRNNTCLFSLCEKKLRLMKQ